MDFNQAIEELKNLADDFNVRDARKLYQMAKARGMDMTRAQAREALASEVARQVFKQLNRTQGKSAAEQPNDRFQVDLVDFSANAKASSGNKFIVLATDVFTRETEGKAVLLAPLAIDTYAPDVNYNAFLKGAMDEVAQKGYRYVLMHGDPDMYADDGFKTARSMGIESAVNYPGTELLVMDFDADNPADIQGSVAYPPFLK
mgnify:CR=1 FL=1